MKQSCSNEDLKVKTVRGIFNLLYFQLQGGKNLLVLIVALQQSKLEKKLPRISEQKKYLYHSIFYFKRMLLSGEGAHHHQTMLHLI